MFILYFLQALVPHKKPPAPRKSLPSEPLSHPTHPGYIASGAPLQHGANITSVPPVGPPVAAVPSRYFNDCIVWLI